MGGGFLTYCNADTNNNSETDTICVTTQLKVFKEPSPLRIERPVRLKEESESQSFTVTLDSLVCG